MTTKILKSLALVLEEAEVPTKAQSESKLQEAVETAENENMFLVSHAEEIEKCLKLGLISTLETVLATIKVLRVCSASVLDGNDFICMFSDIKELEDKVKSLPGPQSELGSGSVCNLLRSESSKLKEAFKMRLKKFLRQSIQIDNHCVRVLKGLNGLNDDDEIEDEDGTNIASARIRSQEISMAGVWDGISATFANEPYFSISCIEEIVEDLWKVVIEPLLAIRDGVVSSSGQASSQGAVWFLVVQPNGGAKTEWAVITAKIQVLCSLLEFLRNHVFPKSENVKVSEFGPPSSTTALASCCGSEKAFRSLIKEKLLPQLRYELAQSVTSHVLVDTFDAVAVSSAVSLRTVCDHFDTFLKSEGIGTDGDSILLLNDFWARLPSEVAVCTKRMTLDCLRGIGTMGYETLHCTGFLSIQLYRDLHTVGNLVDFGAFSVHINSIDAVHSLQVGMPSLVPSSEREVSVITVNYALLLAALIRATLTSLTNVETMRVDLSPNQVLQNEGKPAEQKGETESVIESFVGMLMTLMKASCVDTLSPRKAAILANDYRFMSNTCLQCATLVRQLMSEISDGDDGEINMSCLYRQAVKCASKLRKQADLVLSEQSAEQKSNLERLLRRMRLSVDNETVLLDVQVPSIHLSDHPRTEYPRSDVSDGSTRSGLGDHSDHNTDMDTSRNNHDDLHQFSRVHRDTVPTGSGVGSGVYGIAQSMGALETSAHSLRDNRTNKSVSGVGLDTHVGSVSGLGIRRGLVGLFHAFDTKSRDVYRVDAQAMEGGFNDIKAAETVTHHFLLLLKQWKGALPSEELATMMGDLLEHAVQALVGAILSSPCVEEVSIEGLVGLLTSVLSCEDSLAKDCFLPAIQSSSEESLVPGIDHDPHQAVAVFVPSWPKLAALVRFLVCPSLSAVAEALSKRQFAAFSSAELSALVCSVFEDSPKRAHILLNIHQLVSAPLAPAL